MKVLNDTCVCYLDWIWDSNTGHSNFWGGGISAHSFGDFIPSWWGSHGKAAKWYQEHAAELREVNLEPGVDTAFNDLSVMTCLMSQRFHDFLKHKLVGDISHPNHYSIFFFAIALFSCCFSASSPYTDSGTSHTPLNSVQVLWAPNSIRRCFFQGLFVLMKKSHRVQSPSGVRPCGKVQGTLCLWWCWGN